MKMRKGEEEQTKMPRIELKIFARKSKIKNTHEFIKYFLFIFFNGGNVTRKM
jgi:hypothetical protein